MSSSNHELCKSHSNKLCELQSIDAIEMLLVQILELATQVFDGFHSGYGMITLMPQGNKFSFQAFTWITLHLT